MKEFLGCKAHRDEFIALIIYLVFLAIILALIFVYKVDLLSTLLILLIIIPLLLEAMNKINSPCPKRED